MRPASPCRRTAGLELRRSLCGSCGPPRCILGNPGEICKFSEAEADAPMHVRRRRLAEREEGRTSGQPEREEAGAVLEADSQVRPDVRSLRGVEGIGAAADLGVPG